VTLVTVLGGVALGGVDLLLQKVLPYPWANLANSSAVWALAGYALALWVGKPWWRSAAAAAALLVIAVPTYYLAATIFLGDELAILWEPVGLIWMGFGLLAGVVFGIGAHWARTSGWRRIAGMALPGAALFAEALVAVLRSGDAAYRHDQRLTALIELALGVLVVLAIGRTARQRFSALAAAAPLALAGFVAFRAGGF
jgi:hypothetical protein